MPHHVLNCVNEVAYHLELLDGENNSPVFHMSMYKKKGGYAQSDFCNGSLLCCFCRMDLIFMFVLDCRWIRQEGRLVEELLVYCQGLLCEDTPWRVLQSLFCTSLTI